MSTLETSLLWTEKLLLPVVEVQAGRAPAAGVDVVDAVVGDAAAGAVGAVGVDAAAVGGLEHHVVDQVVGDLGVGGRRRT